MVMDLGRCGASIQEKTGSISAVSTAFPSPATSFDQGSDLHHMVDDFDWWTTQQKSTQDAVCGELRDEQEARVLPRTSSECSEFWTRIQEEAGLRSRAGSTVSTDYDFRPRTPTVFNEYHGDNEAAPVHPTVVSDEAEAELLKRNSELEDRVAELERKLLELAAQKGAA